MIGILVVTHGNFAKEIIKSAELIIGVQDKYKTLGLVHGDDIDKFKADVSASIEELDEGDGVLMFVDFLGGSPFNAAAMSMHKLDDNSKLECIIGVNFSMVLEAFLNRESYSLEELKNYCIKVGIDGIKDLREEFDFAN